MLTENNITWKQRAKELIIDYVVIIIYLLILSMVASLVYSLIFDGIPEFTELQNQILVTVTSVVPIVLIFSYLDFKSGSIGKLKANLKLYYENKSYLASLIRNIIKFLPWQIAHMGIIHGMYSDFDILSSILSLVGFLSLIVLLIMGLTRKDKRHLGDLLAKTQVQPTQHPTLR